MGPRKTTRIFRGGARETHVTRVTTKRLLAITGSFPDIPAFLGPHGSKSNEIQLNIETNIACEINYINFRKDSQNRTVLEIAKDRKAKKCQRLLEDYISNKTTSSSVNANFLKHKTCSCVFYPCNCK